MLLPGQTGCEVKKFSNADDISDHNIQFQSARSDDGPTEPVSFPQPTIGICELLSTLRAFDPTDGTCIELRDVVVSQGSGYAYWLRTTLRKAIYGSVVHCPVLTRSSSPSAVNADWVITDMDCAIKIVDLGKLKTKEAEHSSENPLKEIAAVQHLMKSSSGSAPQHVLSIFEAVQDDEHLFIVMPFCRDGELFDMVSGGASLYDEAQTRSVMNQVLVGVKAMHDAGICHRDLSLENVLLNDGNCRIIDFGLCLRVPQHEGLLDKKSIRIKPQGRCGKLFYMAPEIYENTDAFNPYAIDVWSLGAMLFMMLTSSPPYDRPSTTDDMFVWVSNGKLDEIICAWGLQLSPEVIDLMSGMMCVDPEKRLTLDEIMEHPWMKNHGTSLDEGVENTVRAMTCPRFVR